MFLHLYGTIYLTSPLATNDSLFCQIHQTIVFRVSTPKAWNQLPRDELVPFTALTLSKRNSLIHVLSKNNSKLWLLFHSWAKESKD